jgi:hypothetical protein
MNYDEYPLTNSPQRGALTPSLAPEAAPSGFGRSTRGFGAVFLFSYPTIMKKEQTEQPSPAHFGGSRVMSLSESGEGCVTFTDNYILEPFGFILFYNG